MSGLLFTSTMSDCPNTSDKVYFLSKCESFVFILVSSCLISDINIWPAVL